MILRGLLGVLIGGGAGLLFNIVYRKITAGAGATWAIWCNPYLSVSFGAVMGLLLALGQSRWVSYGLRIRAKQFVSLLLQTQSDKEGLLYQNLGWSRSIPSGFFRYSQRKFTGIIESSPSLDSTLRSCFGRFSIATSKLIEITHEKISVPKSCDFGYVARLRPVVSGRRQ